MTHGIFLNPVVVISPIELIIFITIIAIVIGIGIMAIIWLKKKIDIYKNSSALYGPPKRNDNPEDLYGCPRPDDIDE